MWKNRGGGGGGDKRWGALWRYSTVYTSSKRKHGEGGRGGGKRSGGRGRNGHAVGMQEIYICDPLLEKGTFPAKVHSWLRVLIGPKVSSSKSSVKYMRTIPIVLPRTCVSTIAIHPLQSLLYASTKTAR